MEAIRAISNELKLAKSIVEQRFTSDQPRKRGRIGVDVEISPKLFSSFNTSHVSGHYGVPEKILAIGFDPISKSFALSSSDGLIKLFSYSLVETVLEDGLNDESEVNLPCFIRFSNFETLVGLNLLGDLWVWDISLGFRVGFLESPMRKSNVIVTSVSLAKTAAEGYALIGLSNSTVQVMEYASNCALSGYCVSPEDAGFPKPESPDKKLGAVVCIECNPSNSSYALIGYKYGGIILWDWEKRIRCVLCKAASPATTNSENSCLICVSWHPKGNAFIAGYSNGSYAVFDTKNASAPMKLLSATSVGFYYPITSFEWLNIPYNGAKTVVLAVTGGSNCSGPNGISFLVPSVESQKPHSKMHAPRPFSETVLNKISFLPIGEPDQKLLSVSFTAENTNENTCVFHIVSLLDNQIVHESDDNIDVNAIENLEKIDKIIQDQVVEVSRADSRVLGEAEISGRSRSILDPSTFNLAKAISCISFSPNITSVRSHMIRHQLQQVESKHISKGEGNLRHSCEEHVPIHELIVTGHKDGSVSLWNSMKIEIESQNPEKHDTIRSTQMELLYDMPILMWLKQEISAKSVPEEQIFDDVSVTSINVFFDSTDSCHIAVGFSTGSIAVMMLGKDKSNESLALIQLTPGPRPSISGSMLKKYDSLFIQMSEPIIDTVILGHDDPIIALKLFEIENLGVLIAAADSSGAVSLTNVSNFLGSMVSSSKTPCHTCITFGPKYLTSPPLFALQPWTLNAYDCQSNCIMYSIPLDLELEWGSKLDPCALFCTDIHGSPLSKPMNSKRVIDRLDSDHSKPDGSMCFLICCPTRVALIGVSFGANEKESPTVNTIAMNVVAPLSNNIFMRDMQTEAGLIPLPPHLSSEIESSHFLSVFSLDGKISNYLLPSLTLINEHIIKKISVKQGGLVFSENGDVLWHRGSASLSRFSVIENVLKEELLRSEQNSTQSLNKVETKVPVGLRDKLRARMHKENVTKLQKLFKDAQIQNDQKNDLLAIQADSKQGQNSLGQGKESKEGLSPKKEGLSPKKEGLSPKKEGLSPVKEDLFKGKKGGNKGGSPLTQPEEKGVGKVEAKVAEALQLTNLRGENLNRIEEKTSEMEDGAKDFAAIAAQINKNMDKQDECIIS